MPVSPSPSSIATTPAATTPIQLHSSHVTRRHRHHPLAHSRGTGHAKSCEPIRPDVAQIGRRPPAGRTNVTTPDLPDPGDHRWTMYPTRPGATPTACGRDPDRRGADQTHLTSRPDTVEQTSTPCSTRGGRPCGARRLPAEPRPRRYPGRELRPPAPDQGRGVTLTVPRLRKLPFETQIIERYKRRSRVSRSLIEMYLAGVSVRRWRTSRGAVGHQGQRQHGQRAEPEGVRADRGVAEPADRGRAPVRVPGRIWLKRSWVGGQERRGAVAIGVNATGTGKSWGGRGRQGGPRRWRRSSGTSSSVACGCGVGQVPGAGGGRGRVLPGGGLAAVRGSLLPERVHGRAVGRVREVAAMLKAIHASEDRPAARAKARRWWTS